MTSFTTESDGIKSADWELEWQAGVMHSLVFSFPFFASLFLTSTTNVPKGNQQTAQTDQERPLYLHICITDTRLWPLTHLNSSLATASAWRGHSLSSRSLSPLRLLCLRSVFHPAQLTSLFLTDNPLPPPPPPPSSASLWLCLVLVHAGVLLQTDVGGQDQSRQQEGEERLSGPLKGRLAASSSLFLLLPLSI